MSKTRKYYRYILTVIFILFTSYLIYLFYGLPQCPKGQVPIGNGECRGTGIMLK